MDTENLNRWSSQPDVCRCCLSSSGTWDLTASYITDGGQKEVYSEILEECYGITLSYLSEWGPSRMVCGLCVGHLRDACSFRKQVLQAERHFVNHWNVKKDEQTMIDNECTPHSPGGISDDIAQLGNVDDERKDTIKIQSNTHTVETMTNSMKTEKEHTVSGKKRRKTGVKLKRKRRKIKVVDQYDSDTPIAELSKKNVPSEFVHKVENTDNVDNCEFKENEIDNAGDKVEVSNRGSTFNNIVKKKSPKSMADSYLDNRNLRANITLILKNSTIVPFKHINNSKYICLYCEKSYLFFKELKQHVIEEHQYINEEDITVCLKTPKDLIKADVSDIKCKLCEDNFKNLENFIEHLINKHGKVYYHTLRLKPSHGILGFDLSSERLKCHICNKEFRFFKNLSIHMNEHSNSFICHICGKKFVSDHRLQTHVIMHRRTDIRCKHCNKDFRTISARSYHIRKVHNDSKFKCPECPLVFSQYQHRLKHLVDGHKLKKPEFRCEVCYKEFASSGGLRAHVRYLHLKTTEYPCDVCGKVFVYKWIWQRHMDVHTGAKNYGCKYCNKKFAKPYTLQVHVRIHLNDKRFACTVCKSAFVQKCSLKNHIRVHHPDSGIDLSKL